MAGATSLGVAAGPSKVELFWKGFLRSLADRGLRGSDDPLVTLRGVAA
jgi:hypothetical protein